MSKSHISENNIFIGGMNQDDDPNFIPDGDYTDALNVQVSVQGNQATVVADKGAKAVSGVSLAGGVNACYKAVVDPNNNSLIWFCFNTTAANMAIYEYKYDTDEFAVLYQSSILDFSTPNIHAEVVNNYLIWTDGTYQYKLDLNIARTQPGDRQWRLYFGKWEYLEFSTSSILRSAFTPTTTYTIGGVGYAYSVGILTYDSYRDALEDFATKFNDNENARVGGAKYNAVAHDDYVLVSEIGEQNEITGITITGSSAAEQAAWAVPHNYVSNFDDVVNLDFIRRKPALNPTWTLARYNPTSLSSGINIGNSINSRALEFAYSYVFFDGQESVISEYSAHKPQGPLDASIDDQYSHAIVSIFDDLMTEATANINDDFARDLKGINIYFREYNTGDLKLWKFVSQNDLYPNSADSSDIGFYFTKESNGTAVDISIQTKLFESLPITSGALKAIYTDSGTVLALGQNVENYDYQKLQMTLKVNSAVYTPTTTAYKWLKRGSRYRVGGVFKDKFGRTFGVSLPENPEIYVPKRTESFQTAALPDTDVIGDSTDTGAYISWALVNDPTNIPEWAVSFQLCITENLTYGFFREFVTYTLKIWDTDTDTVVTGGVTAFEAKHEIRIDTSTFEREFGDEYGFVEGDRLRMYMRYNDASAPTYVLQTDGTPNWGDLDFEIIGVTGSEIRLKANVNNAYDLLSEVLLDADQTEADYQGIHCEIWRPSSASDNLFYAFGEIILINNPGKSNRSFSTTNGNTARTYGDSYAISVDSTVRAAVGGDTAERTTIIQTMNRDLSDQSLFWSWDKGQPYVYLPNIKQTNYETQIRIGNQITPENEINQLFTFDSLSRVTLPNSFGAITVLERVGDILLVLCENSRSISFYLNKVTSVDANGQVLAAFSDVLLGGRNVLAGEYGCQHPQTMVVNDGNAWWVDAAKLAVVQYNLNGLKKISSVKMDSYFKALLKQKTDADFIHAGFDYENDNYLLTGVDTTTIAWNRERQRWTSRYNYGPERFALIDFKTFMFVSGIPYLMNSDDIDRANYPRFAFGNTEYDYEIEFVSNINSDMEKVWLSLEVNSNYIWVVPELTNDRGQETEMNSNHVEAAEGKFNFPVMLDKNTPGKTSAQGWVSGDAIRSQHIRILLRGSERTEKNVLKGVIVKAIPSMRTTI